jgi:hypothetical protein
LAAAASDWLIQKPPLGFVYELGQPLAAGLTLAITSSFAVEVEPVAVIVIGVRPFALPGLIDSLIASGAAAAPGANQAHATVSAVIPSAPGPYRRRRVGRSTPLRRPGIPG